MRAFKANEEAALSALFEEFKTPGIAVFEKNSAPSRQSLLPVAAMLVATFVAFLVNN